ncbi:hypothetical protein [Nocardioides sp. W7]|uniref:hypothetical protein n=1 Tax=Nocardioides sp. W7 TaxID=2931390 RepID=UPI001FD418DE|nr:hypothetical protein [Nocardioides sp. W7]
MNALERLRPETRPIDAEWSATTLEAILASHDPSPARRGGRRRRLALVGAATAGVLGLSGVAYAGGLVPALITDHFDETSQASVSGIHELASFTTTKSGTPRTFEIWRGTDADGLSCIAVLEAAATGGPDFGGNCGDYPLDAWFNTTNESWTGTVDDPPPPATYYVYGEPALDGVTTVRVLGDGFDHSVAVDPRTGGYAVAVPELDRGISGHFATVEFIDAQGVVLGTRDLSEK